jgi:hypothetical protein
MLNQNQASAGLMNLARICATCKKHKHFNHGTNKYCSNCTDNIYLYGVDPRECNIITDSVDFQYHSTDLLPLFFIPMIAFLVFCVYWLCH